MARGRLRRGCSLEVILEEDNELIEPFERADSIHSLDSLESNSGSTDRQHHRSTHPQPRRRARSLDYLMYCGDMDMLYSPWETNNGHSNGSYDDDDLDEDDMLDTDVSPDDNQSLSSTHLDTPSPSTRARISRRQIASTWSDRDSPWLIEAPDEASSCETATTETVVSSLKSMFEAKEQQRAKARRTRPYSDDSGKRGTNRVHYLADYDIPELLLNDNVVIVESRAKGNNRNAATSRTFPRQAVSVGSFWPPPGANGVDVLRLQKKNQQQQKEVKSNGAAPTTPTQQELSPTCSTTSSVKSATLGWRPNRLRNKEVVDTELPKPDTVRNVRSVFENILVFNMGDGGRNKMTAVKSNPRSKILRSDSFEKRNKPVLKKSQSVESFNKLHQEELQRAVLKQKMVRNASPPAPAPSPSPPPTYLPPTAKVSSRQRAPVENTKLPPTVQLPPPDTNNNAPSGGVKNGLSKSTRLSTSCPVLNHNNNNNNNSNVSIKQSTTPQPRYNTRRVSLENDSDSDDDEPPRYIPQEVLERIRACGTSITYFGGRVIATNCSSRPLSIVSEPRDEEHLPTNVNSAIRANLNNIFNQHPSVVRGRANGDAAAAPRIVSVVPKNNNTLKTAPTKTVPPVSPPIAFSDSDDERESSRSPFSTSSLSSSSPLPAPRGKPGDDEKCMVFNFTGCPQVKPHIQQREQNVGHLEEAWF